VCTVAEYPEIADLDPFALMDAESERLFRFFTSLADEGWLPDTRCEGWRRREIVAHLAGGDTYHAACLDDTVRALFEEAAKNGAEGGDGFNAWQVGIRADREAAEVLDEWWALNVDVRRRMRELGPEATMSSSVGPYPVDLMALHLASEYATHYDDMDGPVDASERSGRTDWRAKVSRFALKENEKPVEVEETSDGFHVRSGDQEADLSREDFVEAVVVRLLPEHPLPAELRKALRALA
jgi:hypothetical protein